MPKLLGEIKGESLHLDKNWETLEALRELEGKRVEVNFKEWKNTRSNRANRYYWGVVIPSVFGALTENGIKLVNEKQAHRAMQVKFLMEDIEYDGGIFSIPQSTAELSIDEFANYIFVVVEYLRDYYKWEVPEPKEKI